MVIADLVPGDPTSAAELAQEIAVTRAERTAEAAAGSSVQLAPGHLYPPATGPITQLFGPTDFNLEFPFTYQSVYYPHFHTGLDIGVGTGTPVRAADAGTVVLAATNTGPDGKPVGYGTYVVIYHGGDLFTLYGHLSQLGVTVGQKVATGQVIGLSGNTGNSSGPHLHFEVRQGQTPVDPLPLIRAAAPRPTIRRRVRGRDSHHRPGPRWRLAGLSQLPRARLPGRRRRDALPGAARLPLHPVRPQAGAGLPPLRLPAPGRGGDARSQHRRPAAPAGLAGPRRAPPLRRPRRRHPFRREPPPTEHRGRPQLHPRHRRAGGAGEPAPAALLERLAADRQPAAVLHGERPHPADGDHAAADHRQRQPRPAARQPLHGRQRHQRQRRPHLRARDHHGEDRGHHRADAPLHVHEHRRAGADRPLRVLPRRHRLHAQLRGPRAGPVRHPPRGLRHHEREPELHRHRDPGAVSESQPQPEREPEPEHRCEPEPGGEAVLLALAGGGRHPAFATSPQPCTGGQATATPSPSGTPKP